MTEPSEPPISADSGPDSGSADGPDDAASPQDRRAPEYTATQDSAPQQTPTHDSAAPYAAHEPPPGGGAPAPAEAPGASAVRPPPARSRSAVIEAGQPYHLLARNSAHRWWRPLVSLIVFIVLAVLALVAALATVTALATLPSVAGGTGVFDAIDQVLSDPMFLLFAGFATLVVFLPCVWFTVRTLQNRPFSSVSSVVGGLRWGWLGECLGLAAVLLGAVFALGVVYELIAGPGGPIGFPGWPTYLTIAAVALLVVPLQCAAEEYAFRGFLVQTLTAWFRTPWIAIVLSSVAFLFSHGYTDVLVWIQLMLMALVMCWLTIRTGGLEAAIGLHIANNVLSLLVAGIYGVPSLEQAGDFAAADVVPFLIVIPLYGWLADRRAQRRELHNVLGGRASVSPWTLGVERVDLRSGRTE